MYINIDDLFLGILLVLLICVLAILIPCLIKTFRILTKFDNTLKQNNGNLNTTLKNVKDISVNIKDMSNVATEFTADVIVAKENINNKIHNTKEIIKLIGDVFLKSN